MGSENRGNEDTTLDATSGVNPYPPMLALVRRRVVARNVERDSVRLDDNIVGEAV